MSDQGVFTPPQSSGLTGGTTLGGYQQSQQNQIDPYLLSTISSSIGWAKFAMVIRIIFGALSCLSIIGAAYGIPMIISAVSAMRGADAARMFAERGDMNHALEALSEYSRQFKTFGIAVLIGLILFVLIIIFYVAFFAAMFSTLMSNL